MRLGILGGGQLARMLNIKGHELGLEISVLSEGQEDPAAQVSQFWQQGSYKKHSDLVSFLKKIDFLTFESEFVDCELLKTALKEASFSLDKIAPSIDNMQIFQDRWSQKNLFQKYKIPTSEFYNILTSKDLENYAQYFNYSYVLKKRFGGYDGYGTFISRNKKEHEKNILSLAPSNEKTFHFIMEKFITFKNELACQFFRNGQGQFFYFPLVESFQSQSKCDWVMGPTKHPEFKSLALKIKKMMSKQNYVGALAFEFFNTGKELIVNESAPRVHNSGHYTLNYPLADQFSLHLKSCLNYQLPKMEEKQKYSFVMTNLIGKCSDPVVLPKDLTGHLHWYGKNENRPGRKMGHINYIDTYSEKNSKNLLKKALKERQKVKL